MGGSGDAFYLDFLMHIFYCSFGRTTIIAIAGALYALYAIVTEINPRKFRVIPIIGYAIDFFCGSDPCLRNALDARGHIMRQMVKVPHPGVWGWPHQRAFGLRYTSFTYSFPFKFIAKGDTKILYVFSDLKYIG